MQHFESHQNTCKANKGHHLDSVILKTNLKECNLLQISLRHLKHFWIKIVNTIYHALSVGRLNVKVLDAAPCIMNHYSCIT